MSREELLRRMSEAEERQRAREEAEDQAVFAAFDAGYVPTTPDIRSILAARNFSDRDRLMCRHPYWMEWMLRKGFDGLFGAALAAYTDVVRHNAALGALSASHDGFDEHVDHMVSNPSQKDVFAYCTIVIGIVDNHRRIRKIRPDLEEVYDQLLTKHLKRPVANFVKHLRRNLSHGQVVMADWSISRDENGTTGRMLLDAENLLRIGEWDETAREYIRAQPRNRVDIAAAITEHFTYLSAFRKDIQDFFARNVSYSELDYHEIEDSHRERGYVMSVNLLVSQIAKGRDPYDYLHRFFDKQEVRQILRYPKHSKQQVDFIISLKAAQAACPDSLRRKIYDIFGVRETET